MVPIQFEKVAKFFSVTTSGDTPISDATSTLYVNLNQLSTPSPTALFWHLFVNDKC